MKYQLLRPINNNYSALEQILTNRGIAQSDIQHYLNTTDDDINDPRLLGEEKLCGAARALVQCVSLNKRCLVVVDADCDGYTSSALLLNYLYSIFPSWVETNVEYFMHDGKKHGLADCADYALDFDLVIVPDAGSNDVKEHELLASMNIPLIVLDHHEVDAEINPDHVVLINNQNSSYPNKALSGVGVTWQFCRYLDSILATNNADKLLDLVALGLIADMMPLTSFETKHLVLKGLQDDNLHNPFICTLAEKNRFSLGSRLTPIGVAFYIAPFVNAMVRSGTPEEQDLLFSSMLNYKAFTLIKSNKRGAAPGEMTQLVNEAVRIAQNVKARQTKAQDSTMEHIEDLITSRDLLQHQVLLFLLNTGEVDKNIAGLAANKIMGKYQRPCCILTAVDHDGEIVYEGSARGCDLAGVKNFKEICEATNAIDYAAGHQGAFGLGIKKDSISEFIAATDLALRDISTEPIYYVDYIYDNMEVSAEDILDIGGLDDLWGTGMSESYIAIKNINVSAPMVVVYHKKDNTLKITLPNGVSLMKFKADDDLCDMLQNRNPGFYTLDIVGKCKINEWGGSRTPQIFIEDFNIHGQSKYNF